MTPPVGLYNSAQDARMVKVISRSPDSLTSPSKQIMKPAYLEIVLSRPDQMIMTSERVAIPQMIRSLCTGFKESHMKTLIKCAIACLEDIFHYDIVIRQPYCGEEYTTRALTILDFISVEDASSRFNYVISSLLQKPMDIKLGVRIDVDPTRAEFLPTFIDGTILRLNAQSQGYTSIWMAPDRAPGEDRDSDISSVALIVVQTTVMLYFIDCHTFESLFVDKTNFLKTRLSFTKINQLFDWRSVNYDTIRYHIWSTLGGQDAVSRTDRGLKIDIPELVDNTIGVVSCNNFVVSPCILDANLPLAQKLRFKAGQGGIYTNEQVTRKLESIPKSICKTYYGPRLGNGFDPLPKDDYLASLPRAADATANINFQLEAYTNEVQTGRMQYGWFILARGPDGEILADVWFNPFQLLFREHNDIDINKPKSPPHPDPNILRETHPYKLPYSRSEETKVASLMYLLRAVPNTTGKCLITDQVETNVHKVMLGLARYDSIIVYSNPSSGESLKDFCSRIESLEDSCPTHGHRLYRCLGVYIQP